MKVQRGTASRGITKGLESAVLADRLEAGARSDTSTESCI